MFENKQMMTHKRAMTGGRRDEFERGVTGQTQTAEIDTSNAEHRELEQRAMQCEARALSLAIITFHHFQFKPSYYSVFIYSSSIVYILVVCTIS